MTDVGFVGSDKMKIVGHGQVHICQGVLLIAEAAQVKPSVEADENSVVQSGRESRRSEGDITGSFTLLASQWVGQGLKSHQRLNARSADDPAGAVFGVVCGKAKELDCPADVRHWYHIQFIRAQRLVGIHQAVDSI